VLKTDDDCYVRFEALLRTLRPPPTPLIGLDGLPVMGAAAAAAAARSAEPVDSVRLEKVGRAPAKPYTGCRVFQGMRWVWRASPTPAGAPPRLRRPARRSAEARWRARCGAAARLGFGDAGLSASGASVCMSGRANGWLHGCRH